MQLYAIHDQMFAILSDPQHTDPDTGELTREAYDALEALNVAQEQKCLDIACVLRDLDAEHTAVKAESKRLADRAKRVQRKYDGLKDYLSQYAAGESYKDGRVDLRWRKSRAVRVHNEELIPDDYWVTTETTRPNLTAIGEAIKGGREVPGCVLEERNNIQIK